MTNFLPAAIINETISDMNQKSGELKQNLADIDLKALKKGLEELEEMALDLWVFIERFTCQPLMYTGSGETHEVIKRLDDALRFYEEHGGEGAGE
ncbi:MAG: hypothetical protein U9N81_10570 [Bacillota bacterium]|nr:hypothetical protein [Bacillota bacterium]